MYLKKLTLHGFKSFADRTVFNFYDGITSIVGPNGCGKSNIVDALKWIFGEQSVKDLRGQSMKDIIFAGTATRKPINFAEVVVVFDNTEDIINFDYSEISVTRRLFRSGESEYRINGNKCRLKDIKELFVDTGIGTESYSILEQGKLDMLLQASPRERRFIFEEAAGISRFRLRRDEALRQLKRTGENLSRLSDIISEIESRIRSVRIQAGRARRFRELEHELKNSRLQLSWKDLMRIYKERSEWTFRHLHIKREIKRLTRSHETIESEYNLWKGKCENTEKESRLFESNYHDSKAKQLSLNNTIQVTNKRIYELKLSQKRWIKEAEETQNNLEQYETEIANLSKSKEKAQQEQECITKKNKDLNNRLSGVLEELNQAKQQLSYEKASLIETLDALTFIRNNNSKNEAEENLAHSRLDRLENEEKRFRKTTFLVSAEINKARNRYAAVSSQYIHIEKEKSVLKDKIDNEAEKLQQKERQWADTKTRIESLASRCDLLQRLLSDLDGVNEATRSVIHAAREKKLTCVKGLFAELISTDAMYARAIEGVLGPWAQAIVVQSQEDLEEVKEYLGPEASFSAIVLDNIMTIHDHFKPDHDAFHSYNIPLRDKRLFPGNKPDTQDPQYNNSDDISFQHSVPETFKEETSQAQKTKTESTTIQSVARPQGVMPSADRQTRFSVQEFPDPSITLPDILHKPATELVSYPPELRQAVFAILGRTLVVKDEVWKNLDAQEPLSHRIVSQSGGILETWGGIRWGTPTGVLIRRTELTQCNQEKSWLESAEENLSGEVSHVKTELLQLRETFNSYTNQQTILHGRKQALAELIKQVSSRSTDLRLQKEVVLKEKNVLQLEINNLKEQRLELKQKLKEIESKRLNLEQHVIQQEENVTASGEKQRKLEAEIAENRIRKATQHEKIHMLQETCERLSNLVKDKKSHIEEAKKEQVQSAERAADAENELSLLQEDLSSQIKLEKDLKIKLTNSNELLTDLRKNFLAKEKSLKELTTLNEEKQKELSEIQLEERELAVKADSIIQTVEEEYQINIGAIARGEEENENLFSIDPLSDTGDLRKRVVELKQRLDRHGNINLAAIDELKELEDRYGYLTEQRDDLVKARNRFNNVIKDLNRKSRQLFSETFEKVNKSFGELFRKAFNGGKAELVLEEGEDILTAGIDIIARPPGKKTSGVRLLSGGERTLVTMVLLFSIMRIRPAPFCILDEVDAPLDEANIRRFLVLIDEFIARTQFLIITHNKLTMTKSDSLIGITMEEKGISKIITMDLKEAEAS